MPASAPSSAALSSFHCALAGGDHPGPQELAELDGPAADAAARGHDKHVLAGLQLRPDHQHAPGGAERYGDARGFLERHPFGENVRVRGFHPRQLGVAAAPATSQHAVSGLETGGVRPRLHHLARHFHARDVGQGRLHSVTALPCEQVPAVERRRLHAYQQIAGADLRLGDVAVGQNLRAAGFRDEDRFHGFGVLVGENEPGNGPTTGPTIASHNRFHNRSS